MPAITLSPEPTSTAVARRFVAHALGDAAVDAHLAALLVSELVANVIRHSCTPFKVVVTLEPDAARVEVRNGSELTEAFRAVVAHPPSKVDPDASGGRGWMLIARLSARYGLIDHGAAGKTAWFELPVHPAV